MDIRISNSVIVVSVSIVIATAIAAAPFEWAKLVTRVLSIVFNGFTRRYTAASVQNDATKLINKHVLHQLSDVYDVQFKVSWVENPADARLHQNGRVIVRMRRERDQTRNVLAAVSTALPHILFPHARPYFERRFTTAVDLQLLRILVEVLGDVAVTAYSTDYLEPQTRADPPLHDVLRQLHGINAGALFETVLLQELLYLSDHARNEPLDVDALRPELREFVLFLYKLATREPHDETGSLTFVERHIKVGFILTAKALTAALGTAPYERRLSIKLAQGANSIYLFGLTPDQHRLCRELASLMDKDDRLVRKKYLTVPVVKDGRRVRLPLVHFRRNPVAQVGGDLRTQLAALGLAEGSIVEGLVRRVWDRDAEIEVEEMTAFISARELAWGYHGNVSHFMREGETYTFIVLAVDPDQGVMTLGRKQLTGSPWQVDAGRYTEGTQCSVEIVAGDQASFVVKVRNPPPSGGAEVFGLLPRAEWSWFGEPAATDPAAQVGSQLDAVIILANMKNDELILSRRVLESKDWDRLRIKYAKGTPVRVRVIRVEYSGVYCELEPGAYGWIQRAHLIKAGHELADFETTVVAGSQFDTVVVGIKLIRRYFQLELSRLVG